VFLGQTNDWAKKTCAQRSSDAYSTMRRMACTPIIFASPVRQSFAGRHFFDMRGQTDDVSSSM
jgi:hypothetical protein